MTICLRTRRLILLVALSTGPFGCRAAPEVTVGQTPAEIDLSQCFGIGTVCTPSKLQQTPLVVPELRRCRASGPHTATLAWRNELEGKYLGGDPLVGPSDHLAVARDGTVWVATATERGAFVAHYDADGQLLGSSETAFDQLRGFVEVLALMLSVDSVGHAYVGGTVALAIEELGWRAQPQFWLGRYAVNAQATGELIQVQGVATSLLQAGSGLQIAVGSDDSLVVAGPGEEQPTLMARLEADGQPRWIQTGIRQAQVVDLVGDAQGGTAVLGTDPRPPPEFGVGSLAMYDQSGNLLWDRAPPMPAMGVGPNRLVAGWAGDLIMLGSIDAEPLEAAGTIVPVVEAVLHRLDREGSVLWATHVSGRIDLTSSPTGSGIDIGSMQPAVDDAGNVVFAVQPLSLYRVSADGSTCSWFGLELDSELGDNSAIVDIGVAPDGSIFVAMVVWGLGWSLARVQL